MTVEQSPLPAGPAPDGHDTTFWEGLQSDQLVIPRCRSCGVVRPIGLSCCAQCWSFDTDWTEVAAVGTVYSWVRSHRDFIGELDIKAPYLTALVELDDVPVRLLGIVIGADNIAINDRVSGVFMRPSNSDWTVLRWQTTEATA